MRMYAPRPLGISVRSRMVASQRSGRERYVQRSRVTQALGHLRLATGQRAEIQFLELLGGQGDRGRNLRQSRHGRAIMARGICVGDSIVVVHFVQMFPIRTAVKRML